MEMLSWCNLEWCHMHASCRWSQRQWIVLWNSQNGKSLLGNQWAVNGRGVCTKYVSLIPKAVCAQRSFLSFLCKTQEICLLGLVSFLWGWEWEWGSFCSFSASSFCLCLCASFPVSLIDSVWEMHTNTMSPKHQRLGSWCLWTWQWKQWYPLPSVRAESCGGHCLACLPSEQLAMLGWMMHAQGWTDRKTVSTVGIKAGKQRSLSLLFSGRAFFWTVSPWPKHGMCQNWVPAHSRVSVTSTIMQWWVEFMLALELPLQRLPSFPPRGKSTEFCWRRVVPRKLLAGSRSHRWVARVTL